MTRRAGGWRKKMKRRMRGGWGDFNPQIRLFLAASFSFGLSQALIARFLNFCLEALGLGAEWQGRINALPAITLALVSLPLVAVARRIGNARVIQIGAGCTALGLTLL